MANILPDLIAVRRPQLQGSRYFAFETVQETLAKIYDHGSWLSSVTIARFDGDRPFVTGVELLFGSLPATFRANKDGDTLVATIGPLVATLDETLVDVSPSPPWSACLGLEARWLWELTNQQGYTDASGLNLANGPNHLR